MMTLTSYFDAYLSDFQPFKPYWNYEDGCLLLGCARLYEATGNSRYAEFVLDYLSQRVTAEGEIPSYLTAQHCLDSFNCGKLLFFAERLTADSRYRKAAAWQAAQLRAHPRTESGLCWHKEIYPQQVWIDGIYMAAPFLAEYALKTNDSGIFDEIRRWFRYAETHLYDSAAGLYRHAVDEARTQPWADPETGCSPAFWLRGEGWYLMALSDTLALLPASQEDFRAELSAALSRAAAHLLPYRAEQDGLFYQVIDMPELRGNYTETSGSLMTAYAFLTGAERGVLPPAYRQTGLEMLDAVTRTKFIGGHLTDICSSAGLGGAANRDGSPAYYLSEPAVSDDPKGVGVLMLTLAAAEKKARSSDEKAC